MSDQNSALLKVASNVKLFNGMPRTLLVKLLSCSDKRAATKHELYFNEGDVGESFYVLVIGQVIIERLRGGTWFPLATLKSGYSFGEMTLVNETIRSARVRALTDCVALFFPMQRLRPHPDVASALYQNIAKVLVGRLKVSNSTVMDLTSKLTVFEKAATGSGHAKPEEATVPAVQVQQLDQQNPAPVAEDAAPPTPPQQTSLTESAMAAIEKKNEWWLETIVSG